MITKICTKCCIEKDISEFHKDKHAKDGTRIYCKECDSILNKLYMSKNKEKIAKRKKSYRENNREKINSIQKQYLKTKNGKINHNLQNQRRRARKRNLPNTLTKQEWQDTLEFFNNSCANCGSKDDLHMDHFIPLSDEENCSGTTKFNCIPLCEDCNSTKNKKNPEVFFSKESFERITKYLLAFV